MKILLCAALCLGGGWLFDQAPGDAQAADRAAVEQAVRDYVEAFYLVEPDRIDRSVDPKLQKYGFWRNEEGAYQRFDMNHAQLKSLATEWNTEGRVGGDAPKEIVVFEVLDKIATAKLVADWGIDYMHLVKLDGEDGGEGRWMITQVVWQSAPAVTEVTEPGD